MEKGRVRVGVGNMSTRPVHLCTLSTEREVAREGEINTVK